MGTKSGKKTKRARASSGAGEYASTAGDKLFKVILVLLAIILVIMLIVFAVKVNDVRSYYVSTPDDLLRTMNNGYYSDAVVEMHDNIAQGDTAEKNADYEIPYALCRYFDAEYQYEGYLKAAELTTDEAMKAEIAKKAEEYKAIMEESKAQMGDLVFMTEDIDKIFNSPATPRSY